MTFPADLRLEKLASHHRRSEFRSGSPPVDDWLASKALQAQKKHLSVTRVLVDADSHLAGYYTLATGQVDLSDLPPEMRKRLPRRALPVAIVAWLGVATSYQRRGLGRRLLAQALRDCYEAGKTFPFVAVILDALDDAAKTFYQRWDFRELPGHPYRLYLSAKMLAAMMEGPARPT